MSSLPRMSLSTSLPRHMSSTLGQTLSSASSAAHIAREEASAAILSSTWREPAAHIRHSNKPISISADGMMYQATITPPQDSTTPKQAFTQSQSQSQSQSHFQSQPQSAFSSHPSQSQSFIPSHPTFPSQSSFPSYPCNESDSMGESTSDESDSDDMHDSIQHLSIQEQEQRYWQAYREEQNKMTDQERRRKNRDPPRTPAESLARADIISVLGCVLEQVFSSPDQLELPTPCPSTITMFHTERIPTISIRAYFERIAKYGDCSAACLVLALIHINRILHSRPQFHINAYNIHRLLLTSVLCSAKFFDDHYFNNAFYAKVGGIPCRELNFLEVEFLALINFDLHVRQSVYARFFTELCSAELHDKCDCQHASIEPMNIDERETTRDSIPFRVLSSDGGQPHRLTRQTSTSSTTSTSSITSTKTKPVAMKYPTWAQAVATKPVKQMTRTYQPPPFPVQTGFIPIQSVQQQQYHAQQQQQLQLQQQQIQQQQRHVQPFVYQATAATFHVPSTTTARKTPPLPLPSTVTFTSTSPIHPSSHHHPHVDTETISPTLSCSSSCSGDSPTPSMSSSTSSLVSLSASSCSASSSAASTPQNMESPTFIASNSSLHTSHKRRAGASFTFQPHTTRRNTRRKSWRDQDTKGTPTPTYADMTQV